MKSDFIERDKVEQILFFVSPKVRLICEVAIATGLRIGDIVLLKTSQIQKSNRVTVREQKTRKSRRIYLRRDLLCRLRAQSGDIWVFSGRNSSKHFSRQGVWKALKKAAKLCGYSENISPHTFRKYYAVNLMRKGFDLQYVSRRLGHSSEFVTMIYALADVLSKK